MDATFIRIWTRVTQVRSVNSSPSARTCVCVCIFGDGDGQLRWFDAFAARALLISHSLLAGRIVSWLQLNWCKRADLKHVT